MQIAIATKSTEQGKWREGGSIEQTSMSRRQNEVWVQLLTHCVTLKVCCPSSTRASSVDGGVGERGH